MKIVRIFKQAPAFEIVVSRVIKKKTQAASDQIVEVGLEKSLEQLDSTLAGVFQKAA